MKAAILFRDGDIKYKKGKFLSHDTLELYKVLINIDPSIAFPAFQYPDDFPDVSRWPECLEETLRRFNQDGDASSRYGIRGHRVFPDDLLKFDRMIFHIRTRCRARRLSSESQVVDSVEDDEETRHLEIFWGIKTNGVLERALKGAGERSDSLAAAARAANVAFLRGNAPRPSRLPSSVAVGAFPDWLFPTNEADADVGIVRAVDEVLRWAQGNVFLPPDLKSAIRQALGEIAGRSDWTKPPSALA